MKLLTKTSLYFISISLLIFFFSGIGIYQLVKRMERKKVNQELTDQMQRFGYDLSQTKINLKNATIITSGLIDLQEIKEIKNNDVKYADTLIYDPLKTIYTPYRYLRFYINSNGHNFKIHLYKSLIRSNYLIEQIALIITLLIIFFLLSVYFMYKFVFKEIWADFFTSIYQIKHFDLSGPEKLHFEKSMIIEFNELNEVLKQMSDRIQNDYSGLQEFTGNLTHEVQNPIAIINSKTQILMQDNSLSENNFKLIGVIHQNTLRVSKIIKALSLLSKIDYNQFHNIQTVNFIPIIENLIINLEELLNLKNIKIFRVFDKDLILQIDQELANILIQNLVINAIRHNITNGYIKIITEVKKLTIINTGKQINFDPNILIGRFTKAEKSDSLGIGLSIVKKICNYYHFKLNYQYSEPLHTISIEF